MSEPLTDAELAEQIAHHRGVLAHAPGPDGYGISFVETLALLEALALARRERDNLQSYKDDQVTLIARIRQERDAARQESARLRDLVFRMEEDAYCVKAEVQRFRAQDAARAQAVAALRARAE